MRPNSRCLCWGEAERRGIAIAASVRIAFARIAFARIALVRIALVGIALGVCGAGCSSSKGPPSDGGPGAAGAGGTDATADGASDGSGADAAGSTCQQIRLCAFGCTDEACVTTCAQHGSPAAQAAFQNVRSCTQASAPDGGGCTSVSDPSYRNCFCLAQCLEDPPCAATLDPCLGNVDDSICDGCA